MNSISFADRAQVCLVVFMVLVAGSVLAGEEVVRDGVLHITNESSPSEGVETVNLEEVWRVGGEDGEDFFGLITQVLVEDDGSIYLLDTRLSEVPVYSPEGERLTTLSREGEGPGETRMPTNLVKMPDGNLGLVQRFPGKITMIDWEGNPQGQVEPKMESGGLMALYDCFPHSSGQLTIIGNSFKQNGSSGRTDVNFVSNFSTEGAELVRFTGIVNEMDFSNFHFKEDEQNEITFRKAAVGADGRVYLCKSRNLYQIHVYLPDGQLDRVIEREYEHRQRTDEEYQRVYNMAESQMSRLPNAKFDISKIEPDVNSLRFAEDGNLWVTSSQSGYNQPEGILVTYDVFNPDGHFIKQVAASCEGDGKDDNLFWAPDGSAVLVTGFTDALMSLQTSGMAGGDDDEEAEPMEVIYMRPLK